MDIQHVLEILYDICISLSIGIMIGTVFGFIKMKMKRKYTE